MEWHEYLEVLFRQKRIIIAAVVICVAAAGLISFLQRPTYEAVSSITTSDINVVAIQDNNNNSNIISSLDSLRDAVDRTGTLELATKVKAETGVDIPASDLTRMVRVEPGVDVLGSAISNNTTAQIPIIQLAVTDTDKSRAVKLANAYANVVIQDSQAAAEAKIKKTLDLVDKELDKYKQQLNAASAQIYALQQGSLVIGSDGTVSLSSTGSPNVGSYAEWGRIVSEYNTLSGKKNLLRLVQINALNPPLKISERALTANRVQTTMPVSILLGLFVGLTLGVGGAGILEYLSDKQKTPKEMETLFHVPLLGFVSTSPHNSGKYLAGDSEALLAEDYRLLRTRIQTATYNSHMRSFLMGSSLKEYNAPIVLSNLAIAFAQAKARVLIISSNLRDSMVMPFFFNERDKSPGLSNWLKNGGNVGDLIKKTGIENLYVLPPGPRDAVVIRRLDTAQIEELLKQVGKEYDYVFLEGPPINESADAVIIAAAVDGIIIVATYKEDVPLVVENTLQRLESVKDRIIGVVDAGTTAT
jgi:polysaccharide biosynthesis transport protein